LPEGPETKRMADILFKNLVGFEIINSQLLHPDLKKIKNDSNLIIKDVFSRGKAIIIRLENGQSIITHNQLYGKWTSHHLTTKINHNRVLRIEFCTKKKAIRLWSATNIKVLNTSNESEHPYLSKIGPDILDKKTSPETILNRLISKKFINRSFSSILLDQNFISGLGNYLRSEILFFSKLNHTLKSSLLTLEENKVLCLFIKKVSLQAYKQKGQTLDLNYIKNNFGNINNFKKIKHMVFRRDGLPCFNCGTLILKVIISARPIFICSSCQNFNL